MLLLLVWIGAMVAAPVTCHAEERRTSVGVTAGLPLVLGVGVTHQFGGRWRGAVAYSSLSGLNAVQAEGHWFVLKPQARRLTPLLEAGVTQYFLRDGSKESSPVGVHGALGLDFFFDSPFSLAAQVGWLKTFGSERDPAKVFALRSDYSTALFNVAARYHF